MKKAGLPAFMIVVVPIMALLIGLLYQRHKQYYFVHHLTFSYYFFTFFFLILIPSTLHEDLATAGLLALLAYLYLAMRKSYKQDFGKTLAKACIVWMAALFLLYLYINFSVNYTLGEIKSELGI